MSRIELSHMFLALASEETEKNRLQNRLYSNTPMLVWSSCDQNVVILSQVTSKIHVGEINVTFTGGCIDSGTDFDIIWLREGF